MKPITPKNSVPIRAIQTKRFERFAQSTVLIAIASQDQRTAHRWRACLRLMALGSDVADLLTDFLKS